MPLEISSRSEYANASLQRCLAAGRMPQWAKTACGRERRIGAAFPEKMDGAHFLPLLVRIVTRTIDAVACKGSD
jgi:hypothetical protein